MRVQYEKSVGVTMTFNTSELKLALAILKGIHTAIGGGEGFIKDVIRDIEADMKPKLITHTNYFHWCVNCGRDIDERNPDTMRLSNNGDVKWQCRKCKPLKIVRPN